MILRELFLWNWLPHAEFQTLQDTLAPLPRDPYDKNTVQRPNHQVAASKSFRNRRGWGRTYGVQTRHLPLRNRNSRCRKKHGRYPRDSSAVGFRRGAAGFPYFNPNRPPELLDFLTMFRNRIQEMGKTPVEPPSRKKDSTLSPEPAPLLWPPIIFTLARTAANVPSAALYPLRKTVPPELSKRSSTGRHGILQHQGGHLVLPDLRPLL